MPMEHYFRHFDFQPYTSWPGPDFASKTWELHYWLFEKFKYDYGFFLPTAELMDRLAAIVRREIGAGGRLLDAGSRSGFISKELCRRGINAFAVDRCAYENIPRKFGYPLIKVYQRDALGDGIQYISDQFAAVLLIWPPYDQPFAFDVAKAMLPGQLLIFEGEGAGGCTGDDRFFK